MGVPVVTGRCTLPATRFSVQTPFAAVAAFGLYSIAAVLYGVFTFRDCPEEAASLHKVAIAASAAVRHTVHVALLARHGQHSLRCAAGCHSTAVALRRTLNVHERT
jgi:Dolichol-phosphate mannosyltransferase subunit 3 (DPM3)